MPNSKDDSRRWSEAQQHRFLKWWRRHRQAAFPAPPEHWRLIRAAVVADLANGEPPEAIETYLRRMIRKVKRHRRHHDHTQQTFEFGDEESRRRERSRRGPHFGYWDPNFDIEA